MKAVWNGALIAESNNTIVIEGNHYFPDDSLKKLFLIDSTHTSFCPWKGTAKYYSLLVNEKLNENAAWYYSEPLDAAQEIKGYFAFWNGVEIVE